MNLGLSKEGAYFVADAIVYFLKQAKCPEILLDMYPGIDVKEILSQLTYIQQLGPSESDYAEARKKLGLKD